jgi:hypothetical protein
VAAPDGAGGARRIDDPRDWVRREIETVLRRPDAIVVPVLLDGATMPASEELPESLRALADHQAVGLTVTSLAADIDALIESIEQGRIHEHAARVASGTDAEPPHDGHEPRSIPARAERSRTGGSA